VLASRSGRIAPELAAELAGLDADIRVVPCDVADRAAVSALLDTIEDLTTVVHAAGVLDDSVITELNADRLATVLRPKVDATVHLHELAGDAELIMFSSAASVFGGPGQGNYAAANAFLDALARHRRAAGRRGVSLAWGPWETDTGMVADRDRLRRGGFGVLPVAAALRWFDAARGLPFADVVTVRLDLTALRASAAVPALLHELVPPVRPQVELAELPADERLRRLSMLVRGEAAAVLGYPGAESIEADRSFQELGFDSLSSVEFRNRLAAITGTALPATLVFDYPTPADLVTHLAGRFADEAPADDLPALLAELDRLAGALATAVTDDVARDRVGAHVWGVLSALTGTEQVSSTLAAFETASDDEVFALIDAELGES
jgi:acyl carrier protein